MSITINVTQATGGSFSAAGVTTDSLTLTVGGGIGPPGAGNVALAAGDGILITSTANVATINCTVEGVPESVLENLSNVLSGNATTGDVLAWNGTTWAADSNFATLTYVDTAVANLVDAAPGALDTLNELAAAIGDDANFSATITTSLASKAAANHTHAIANVTGLQSALDAKAATASLANVALTGNYSDLLNVPSNFAAANHTHTFSEITNGTATVTGNLTLDPSTGGVIISGGTSAGSLTLNCEQNTHGVTIASPAHSENATYTLTLPSSAGSANQVLTTDGSGALSWSNGSGGISWTSPAPGNSSDSGSAGDVAYGGQYFYLHNGTQWNRVLLSSFGSTGGNVTTYRLLTESSDTLLTEGGDYLSHDGNGTWTQLGSDIDGEAAGDYSGYSVALSSDGSRLAIGAPYNNGTGSFAGHVRIYSWSGSAWTQLGSDIDGEATGDQSGTSVALSSDGSRVAIGAKANDGTGLVAGHVRIYDWSGSAWVQVGSDIDGEAAEDHSGESVALSSDGSRVAIGAIGNDGTGANAGHVRVYSWSGSAWTQLGSDIDGEAAGDYFGTSVSLSGDGSRLAVGARNNDDAGLYAGQVRVFDWSGSAWVQVGSDIDGEAAGDTSGWAVAMAGDGSRVAIGAYQNDGTGSNAGHVRVYGIT